MAATRHMVPIEAKPTGLSIDLSRTAVLVVDMQNDFGAKGGMFDRAGADLSIVRQAIAPTARVIAGARAAGIPIVYVKEVLRADLSDIGVPGSPLWLMCQRFGVGTDVTAPDGQPSRIHVEGTWNTEILPELAPLEGDHVVTKRRWSAFYDTDLDARLRALDVQYLIVTGCTTSICIESTIRDAAYRDYVCILPADCTGQPAREAFVSGHEASLHIIERTFGWISSSRNVLTAIGDGVGRAG